VAKGPEAFRTISEASDEVGVPQHVLRFWETKFSFIRPMKRAGGRRFYRPQDVAVLAGVHRLLHQEGYTIKGVQQLHRVSGLKALSAPEMVAVTSPIPARQDGVAEDARASSCPSSAAGPDIDPDARQRLDGALSGLLAAKARLDALLPGHDATKTASD
jgi:DNA-binding transcriptional MerR regulator